MYRQTSSPRLMRFPHDHMQRKVPSDSSQKTLSCGEQDKKNSVFYVDEATSPPDVRQNGEVGISDNRCYANDAFDGDIEKGGAFRPSFDHLTSIDALTPDEPDRPDSWLATLKFWAKTRRKHIRSSISLSCFLLYNIYLGFAVHLTWDQAATWCEGVKFLTIITAISYLFVFHGVVFKPFLLKPLKRSLTPCLAAGNKLIQLRYFRHVIWCLSWGAIVIFLVFDTQDNRYRLVSATGILVLLFIGFLFSKHRQNIAWHQVLMGTIIQFILGTLILRWSVGRDLFQCLGNKIERFLAVTDRGSAFVFGYLVTGELKDTPLQPAVFAFKVLSVVIFFSFVVSILYYYGVMQVMVRKVGWLLQNTVGTTACESMNAAGNIFLGMTEAPLLIRPYLPMMTKSELHAVMTGGFATIAGSVLAAYINFGINASHLLSASVMSAPAALAYSKLLYPETEQSCTQADNIKIEKSPESNALEAASNGATTAIKLVANIAVNLIAFIAFIALLDGILGFFGSVVQWDFLSFQWILSKLFIPLSLLMGVDWEDREEVANLVGLKTVVNEFVAYAQLAQYKGENALTPRSEAIATFALCGFSNITSIGIQIGALGAMAPSRRGDLSALAVRAMLAGSAACFMTACIAGTLLKE